MKAALSSKNVRQICVLRSVAEPPRNVSSRFSAYCRLAHKDDCLDKKLYPLLTHKHRVVTRKCAACHVYIGRSVKVHLCNTAPVVF